MTLFGLHHQGVPARVKHGGGLAKIIYHHKHFSLSVCVDLGRGPRVHNLHLFSMVGKPFEGSTPNPF